MMMYAWRVNDKISLRPIELKDADKIFKLTEENRIYLRQWLPWVDATRSIRDSRTFIKHMKRGYDDQRSLTTVILYEGEIVGMASFNTIDWANRITYIGYWLAQGYQGKGIMTKVVRYLCNYAFRDLHLNRVEISAAVKNNKSRAIPERIGFQLEGIRHCAEWINDHYVDHAVYGLLANAWFRETLS